MEQRTCSVDGCDRTVRCKELCGAHYSRLLMHGDTLPDVPLKRAAKGVACRIEDCPNEVRCVGLCSVHYDRIRSTGSADLPAKVRRQCSVRSCRRKAVCKGFCSAHYDRARKGKELDAKPLRKLPTASERDDIASRILAQSVDTDGGCIEWRGWVDAGGYGNVSWRSKSWRVHRAMWTVLRGPIPDGDWTIDHLCYNRRCVNVDHLEVVTRAENTMRMMLKKYGHVDVLPEAVVEFLRLARDHEAKHG